MSNIREQKKASNNYLDGLMEYDHYIAVDWSMRTMAIARLSQKMTEPNVIERGSDIQELKSYLDGLEGRKILTIEETTGTQWLYVELHDYVDRIVVCDPYRNRLLIDGAKTDKIDVSKLCLLLRGGLLKEVYHTMEDDYRLRQLISSYEDAIKAVVRLKNQLAAVYRGSGIDRRQEILEPTLKFIVENIEEVIGWYSQLIKSYESRFLELSYKDRRIRCQMKIPGIGLKGAIKIVGEVLSGDRFSNRGRYWSYCGLVRHVKSSGGRRYGYRGPRFNRVLKSVYKTAALAVLRGNNELRRYYDYLIERGVAKHNARQAVARKIASISYGILKHGSEYQPKYRKEADSQRQNNIAA